MDNNNTNNSTNGIPILITQALENNLKAYGVPQSEIDKMTPKEAWELLQQKDIVDQINNPHKEQVYTLEEIESDFDVLSVLKEEAFLRVVESVGKDKADVLRNEMDSFMDHDIAEDYLNENQNILSAEEKEFIQICLNFMRFKDRARVLLYGDKK